MWPIFQEKQIFSSQNISQIFDPEEDLRQNPVKTKKNIFPKYC